MEAIQAVFSWTTGCNNFKAIKDVCQDNYTYNNYDDTRLNKIKQIGTEFLHFSLKWASVFCLADKTLMSPPKVNTYRHALHTILQPCLQVTDIAIPFILPLVAIGSLPWATYNNYIEIKESFEHIRDIFTKDTVSNSYVFHPDKMTKAIRKTASTLQTLPLFATAYFGCSSKEFFTTNHLLYIWGTAGCYFAANNCNYSLPKIILASAGVFMVYRR